MTDAESMAAIKVAATTLANHVGRGASVVVIVHRPGEPFLAHVDRVSGTGLNEVASTIRAVANRAQDGAL